MLTLQSFSPLNLILYYFQLLAITKYKQTTKEIALPKPCVRRTLVLLIAIGSVSTPVRWTCRGLEIKGPGIPR